MRSEAHALQILKHDAEGRPEKRRVAMRKGIFVGLAVLATALFAGNGAYAVNPGFSDASLSGQYVISASGFVSDTSGDEGLLTVNGTLHLTGTGGINLPTDVTFTLADDAGDNIVCQPTAAGGSYNVNSDGTGSLSLTFDSTNLDCFGTPSPASGAMTFALTLGRASNAANPLTLTDFVNLTIEDLPETIVSASLGGTLQKQ